VPRVLIVGAGLTGCTVAHRLAREGIQSVLLERASVPGGLIRSERLHGVLYEPHGSHIFHTEDEEVWKLANSITPFNDYRHRVQIVIEGKILNWPTSTRNHAATRSGASCASARAWTPRPAPRPPTSRSGAWS
jgi:UDP-galactopyranose mutase